MPQLTEIPVSIRSRNQRDLNPSAGTITRIDWDRKDRARNAVRIWGIFLALAFGGILVPFWHFILVPGFFILAWVMLLEKMNEGSRNGGGKGTCPHCGTELAIEKSKWKDRYTDTCGKCFQELEITLQNANQ